MLLSCFDLLQFQGNIPIQMILIKINENYKFWKFDISYDTFGGIMFFRDNMYKKDFLLSIYWIIKMFLSMIIKV